MTEENKTKSPERRSMEAASGLPYKMTWHTPAKTSDIATTDAAEPKESDSVSLKHIENDVLIGGIHAYGKDFGGDPAGQTFVCVRTYPKYKSDTSTVQSLETTYVAGEDNTLTLVELEINKAGFGSGSSTYYSTQSKSETVDFDMGKIDRSIYMLKAVHDIFFDPMLADALQNHLSDITHGTLPNNMTVNNVIDTNTVKEKWEQVAKDGYLRTKEDRKVTYETLSKDGKDYVVTFYPEDKAVYINQYRTKFNDRAEREKPLIHIWDQDRVKDECYVVGSFGHICTELEKSTIKDFDALAGLEEFLGDESPLKKIFLNENALEKKSNGIDQYYKEHFEELKANMRTIQALGKETAEDKYHPEREYNRFALQLPEEEVATLSNMPIEQIFAENTAIFDVMGQEKPLKLHNFFDERYGPVATEIWDASQTEDCFTFLAHEMVRKNSPWVDRNTSGYINVLVKAGLAQQQDDTGKFSMTSAGFIHLKKYLGYNKKIATNTLA